MDKRPLIEKLREGQQVMVSLPDPKALGALHLLLDIAEIEADEKIERLEVEIPDGTALLCWITRWQKPA